MSNFCGGIRLDDSLKVINGVICDAAATTVDVSKAVSVCGQLWDGNLFTVADKVITLQHGSNIGTPIKIKGNCGIGLDGRFFKLDKGGVSLQDGFILIVDVTPTDAAIKVTDADSAVVAPITGTTNAFLLSGFGDTYTVEVSKTGYTTKTQTVTNDDDQKIVITLEAAG